MRDSVDSVFALLEQQYGGPCHENPVAPLVDLVYLKFSARQQEAMAAEVWDRDGQVSVLRYHGEVVVGL